MKKSQGLAVTAMLATGLAFHSSFHGGSGADGRKRQASPTAEKKSSAEEGPWLASCKYWEPVRGYDSDDREKNSVSVSISIKGKDAAVNSTITGTPDDASNCPVAAQKPENRWGIPASAGLGKGMIHTIIATLPDPLHSHAALEFDRDIDALVMAAGDNGYVPSYYWLPWKSHGTALSLVESASEDQTGDNSEQERQPGLIVLKHVPGDTDAYDYRKVIYLFVVGQSATVGINADQFHRAIAYETELAHFGASQSMRPGSTGDPELSVIGPVSTGAAASLRESIRAAAAKYPSLPRIIRVTGSTSSAQAAQSLLQDQSIRYFSFGDNTAFETCRLEQSLQASGYDLRRLAILQEDGTAYGASAYGASAYGASANNISPSCPSQGNPKPYVVRFPREISLLRNAEPDEGKSADAAAKSVPSPYLHLSLKDPEGGDSIPQFSLEQMPLSQEAQLMAIGRQLQRNGTQFIAVLASDILDQLFLAQFLHRACPDARLIFLGGDLLMERDVENVPYIGSVTFSAYNLASLAQAQQTHAWRAFSDSATEAYYNAASYTFWNGSGLGPKLANYWNPLENPTAPPHASLWATAIGSDGYYPLAIVDDCASDSRSMLPNSPHLSEQVRCTPQIPDSQDGHGILESLKLTFGRDSRPDRPLRYPSLVWRILCLVIAILCAVHALAISFPNYWSPLTRDLAIEQGDLRHRRSMSINIGTVMLFCMAFVTVYSFLACRSLLEFSGRAICYPVITALCALLALVCTFRKTSSYFGLPAANHPKEDHGFILFFNILALATLILLPAIWVRICHTQIVGANRSYVGAFFSYRCLHPGSGVSPLTPLLLVLLSWYLWAVFQTLRLRFSEMNRPQLPALVIRKSPWPLFVSDDELRRSATPSDSCLFSNITTLLISRAVLQRFFPKSKVVGPVFVIGYVLTFAAFLMLINPHSLDHFLWQPGRFLTGYELLLSALFFPLIVIALTGWLRLVLIWGSLRRSLLQPLEQLPIRYAFTRLKGTGWMAMMRQGGLLEQWLDMARSTESIRQMMHNKKLFTGLEPTDIPARAFLIKQAATSISAASHSLNLHLANLLSRLGKRRNPFAHPHSPLDHQQDLRLMHAIELDYARFSQALLKHLLLPYWEEARIGPVESEEVAEMPIKAAKADKEEAGSPSHTPIKLHAGTLAEEPMHIRVAEEFLAIRYVSLIRAVLVNMRYLISFTSLVFALTIVAWNSYPFQPRQLIDQAFTGLLLVLGTGVIWVFAQMHRDPILSRITDTNANELGWDFYLRILTFGAVPVLTWLAYQFPEAGGSLLKFLQPSLDVLK